MKNRRLALKLLKSAACMGNRHPQQVPLRLKMKQNQKRLIKIKDANVLNKDRKQLNISIVNLLLSWINKES